MKQKRLFDVVFPALLLFLFFYTFWYLIYFEKSSGLVFGSFAVLAFLFLYALLRSWKGAGEFGLRFNNLIPNFRGLLIPVVVLVGASLLIGSLRAHHIKIPKLKEFISFFLWGFLQQCVFQGYFFRSFESVFTPRRWPAIFLTALVFGLFHIPNLHLMAVTFLGGMYLSWFFSKYRNLFAAGLMHAVISLALVVALKPIGLIPNYRTGPEPLSPIRTVIHQHKTPDTIVGGFIPSDIPSILEHDFGNAYRAIGSEEDLVRLFEEQKLVFAVLSSDDYKRFKGRYPEGSAYLWKSSLIWRRKFPNMKKEIATSILTLNPERLHRLFRSPLVLIANKPPN